MLLKAEAQVLESGTTWGGPKQEPHTKNNRHFQVVLIVVVACGIVLEVHAFNPLATIAVVERGRSLTYATVCAIGIGGDQNLFCWDSPDSSVFKPKAGSWIGIVAGDTFMCGLQSPDRNAVCWDFTPDNQFSVPNELQSVAYKDIAAGRNHVCGIRKDASNLDCWNRDGILNTVPQHLHSFKLVTASDGWTCTVSLLYPPPMSPADDSHEEHFTCWLGNLWDSHIPEDVRQVRYNLISAGESHVCASYNAISQINGDELQNKVICWTLEAGMYFEVPDKNHSYSGFVSGADYSCSLRNDKGNMVCWGPGMPGQNGLQQLGLYTARFSAESITASGKTICGVGLNDKYALRSFCLRPDTYTPQPFLFLLPTFCSNHCLGDRYFPHDSVPSNEAFDQQTEAITQSFCAEPGHFLCLPCYNKPCDVRCKRDCLTHHSESDRNKRHSKGLVVVRGIMAGVLGVLVLFLFLWAFIASFQSSDKEGCRRRFFTTLTNVEHFCQNQERFNKDLIEFSYKDLECATHGFHITNLLGQGSSGCVFKGALPGNRQVAVKKLSSNGVYNQTDTYCHFDGELKLLARLRHENMVNLVGYCHQRTSRNICCWGWPRMEASARIEYRLLVFEYMPNGTLNSHLHHKEDQLDRPFLDWDVRLRIAVQAARGINYLHFRTEPPIIHRDIKSSNILLDENWNARLSDLGISRLGPLGNRTHVSTLPAGTLGYLDPEYYRTQHLTLKSDVYSFGVVLLEVLTGCKAIEAQLEPANIVERCVPIIRSGQAQSILDPKIPPPSSLDKLRLVADIAETCVRMVQQERPSIAEVLNRLEIAAASVN